MDFDGKSLTEISQTEKNKCHMISTVYGILRKKEFINTKNRLVVAEGVKWGWVKQMKVVKRYKFPVISQSWEFNARHDQYRQQYYSLYLQVVKRTELKVLIIKKNNATVTVCGHVN